MRILALDTATEACSVALAIDGQLLTESSEPGNGHSQIILPTIDSLLSRAGISLASLQGIAVGIGPGAFTGVRIGVSVAQGLAFAQSLPLMGINSLEALAMTFNAAGAIPDAPSATADASRTVTDAFRAVPRLPPTEVLACLDARMGEIYWAIYRTDAAAGLIEVCAPRLSMPAQLVELLASAAAPASGEARTRFGIGRGFRSYPQLQQLPVSMRSVADASCLPQAAQIARLALIRAGMGLWSDPAQVQPLYVRDHVARTEAERAAATPTPQPTPGGSGPAPAAPTLSSDRHN